MAIEVYGLTKRYGDTVALDQVDLTVSEGEIFGLLGRNGAGKTTLVESIAGLRRPDSGSAAVLGLDPWRDRAQLRAVLGVQLQRADLHEALTVQELLRLYRSFYATGHDPDLLLQQLGLENRCDTAFDDLSGGQRQRVSVAIALIGCPRVVILDELTTGLDPEARRGIWTLIEGATKASPWCWSATAWTRSNAWVTASRSWTAVTSWPWTFPTRSSAQPRCPRGSRSARTRRSIRRY